MTSKLSETQKPSRRDPQSRYRSMPYIIVYLATWGATVLSHTPTWFHRPILKTVADIIRIIGEATK